MSIPRSQANADALLAQTTAQNQADTNFIANVDSQIRQAIALGQFQCTAITSANVNLTNVYNYYTNLGYGVTFPDYDQQNGPGTPSFFQQPSNFFGYNWVQYWLNAIALFGIKNPARMTFFWSSTEPPFNPQEPV